MSGIKPVHASHIPKALFVPSLGKGPVRIPAYCISRDRSSQAPCWHSPCCRERDSNLRSGLERDWNPRCARERDSNPRCGGSGTGTRGLVGPGPEPAVWEGAGFEPRSGQERDWNPRCGRERDSNRGLGGSGTRTRGLVGP